MPIIYRGTSYTAEEDRHLCNVCIKLSQDSTVRRDHIWGSVFTIYNSSKPNDGMQKRNRRSLQSRMYIIQAAVSKLNECIQQIKCRQEPNDAASDADSDVLNHAKQLMRQDPKYRSGFKFDHVWNIMKDFDQFPTKYQRRRMNHASSLHLDADTVPESPTPDTVPETPAPPPPESSSFAVNAGEENLSGDSSSQETNKSKRTKGDEGLPVLQKDDEKRGELSTSREEKVDRHFELQMQNLELLRQKIEVEKLKIEQAQWMEENKILMMDLDTISDRRRRDYFRKQQEIIMQKREAAMDKQHSVIA